MCAKGFLRSACKTHLHTHTHTHTHSLTHSPSLSHTHQHAQCLRLMHIAFKHRVDRMRRSPCVSKGWWVRERRRVTRHLTVGFVRLTDG